jgi:hypothetical protein
MLVLNFYGGDGHPTIRALDRRETLETREMPDTYVIHFDAHQAIEILFSQKGKFGRSLAPPAFVHGSGINPSPSSSSGCARISVPPSLFGWCRGWFHAWNYDGIWFGLITIL